MDFRALSQMELETQPFPQVEYEFRIFVDETSFDRICNTANDSREVGGILVGEVLRDENGPFLKVDDIIEALHAEESGTELTITHATWNHIHQQMDTTFAGKRILGWYHTHPNFGIFLSERDQFIQQSFFNLPFQIALVYDPVRRTHGVFSWRDSKPWRVRQYWIGSRQHVWDEARELSEPPEAKPSSANAQASETNTDPRVNQISQPFGELASNAWILGAALAGILLGLTLGLTWNRNSGSASRAEVAQEAIAGLNSDLLAVIRGSVGDEAGRTFDDSIARLDSAAQALKPLNGDASVNSAVQSIQDTRNLLDRARRDRVIASQMLQQLEKVIRSKHTPEFVARDLAVQHALIGDLYVQLAREAARAGDSARVSDLLKRAVVADPERKAEYEQQLKVFEQQGTLPSLTETNKSDAQQQPQK
jgi:proteasome lid subunit RPN8/RPN11